METNSIYKKVSVRLVVVADHIILRQGIQKMLNDKNDFEIVGETENGKAALELVAELAPDIVLIDISMETTNGLDIAKQLLRKPSNARIVLFAGPNDEKRLFEALSIGVHGYLQKTLSIDDMREALLAIQSGERVVGKSQAVTQIIVEFHRLAKEQNRLSRGLSSIEIELIHLVSKGYTNKEIGQQHFWSEVQVKRKMQDIYRKLQVTDRAHAVAEAMRQGLI
ncbi:MULTISPECIES: response regulator [Ktedonobacter]|uniref:response regulator n=1 Tax=Ktedonobacter TaxID=363276 RepID=UPI001914FB0E|nr:MULTISPECIES: response regulator transcription factor [Ktedonobacter]